MTEGLVVTILRNALQLEDDCARRTMDGQALAAIWIAFCGWRIPTLQILGAHGQGCFNAHRH
jgi:hypothetical protein